MSKHCSIESNQSAPSL